MHPALRHWRQQRRRCKTVLDDGCTAEDALARIAPPAGEAAAVRAIHSVTLRWYLRLAPLVDSLLQPGQRVAPAVHALLVAALHQLEYSRAAPHSVVNIAVDAARVAGHRGAVRFRQRVAAPFFARACRAVRAYRWRCCDGVGASTLAARCAACQSC